MSDNQNATEQAAPALAVDPSRSTPDAAQLIAQARQGREDAERLEEPDTFWLRDDPEVNVTDLGDFADMIDEGEVARVLCGRSLPDQWIAHVPIPETPDRGSGSEIRLFKTHAEAIAALAATPSPSPEGGR